MRASIGGSLLLTLPSVLGITVTKLWSNQEGTNLDDFAYSCAVNKDGSLYTVGATWGDYGTLWRAVDIMDYYSDFAAVKMDANGKVLWKHQDLSGKSDSFTAVGVDASSGDALVGGIGAGKYNCPTSSSCPEQDSIYLQDDFVAARLSSGDGHPVWKYQAGTRGPDTVRGLSISPSGDLLLVGSTSGAYGTGNTKDAGRDNRYYPYDNDFAAIRLSNSGAKEWSYQSGSDRGDVFKAVTHDTAGNAYICGISWKTPSSGAKTGSGLYVMKLDVNGNKSWEWRKDSPSSSVNLNANDISVDTAGNVYVVGTTNGVAGDDDFYVVKINAGKSIWTFTQDSSPGGKSDVLTGVVVADSGTQIVVAGYTAGSVKGGSTATNVGLYDFMAMGINTSNGSIAWTWQSGTSGTDRVRGICKKGTNYYLVGDTSGGYGGEASKGGFDFIAIALSAK